MRHTPGGAVCAELSGAATQATVIWNFPSGSRGSLDLVFQLSRGFGGANISLSDFLAPAFDAKTDWASGRPRAGCSADSPRRSRCGWRV